MAFTGTRALGAFGLAIAAALVSGCFGDDDNLSTEDAAAIADAEAVITEGVTTTAVDLVSAAVDQFPEWSAGDFAPSLTRETQITWNPESQYWVIHSLEEYGDDSVNGVADFTMTVQFRADGAPVQEPTESVNEMDVHLAGTNIGVFTGDRFTVEYDWSVGFDLFVTRNEDASKHFEGEGAIQGGTAILVNDRVTPRSQDLAWEYAIDLPAQSSCATGALAGAYNDIYELDAQFLGEGEVAWSVTRNGSEVASDTSHYACGPYEPVW
jgi:hypothetical protein